MISRHLDDTITALSLYHSSTVIASPMSYVYTHMKLGTQLFIEEFYMYSYTLYLVLVFYTRLAHGRYYATVVLLS